MVPPGSDGTEQSPLVCDRSGAAYREGPQSPIITYFLEIDEEGGRPTVRHESLHWRRGSHGKPFNFLSFAYGHGQVVSGDLPEEDDERRDATLASPDLLAVPTLGQLAENPRVVALRQFIEGWYLPRLEEVTAEPMADGRLLLRIKDAPFADPFLARFASDGTLKMLACLVLLYDPLPLPLLEIEEPENYLHPRLLYGLAEECRKVSSRGQVFVSTHSPFFVDALRPRELWALERDGDGYTQATRASEMPGVSAFMDEGAQFGALWMENHLSAGNPLRNARIEQRVRDWRLRGEPLVEVSTRSAPIVCRLQDAAVRELEPRIGCERSERSRRARRPVRRGPPAAGGPARGTEADRPASR